MSSSATEQRAASQRPTASRSTADRIARRVLLIGDADPQALMSLKGSLVLSAIRCIITYAILPALSPLIGWSNAIARPVSIVLSLAAVGLAVFSLRRVWLADWTHRWAYSAFIAAVLGFLGWFIVLDTAALLAG
ncbi:MAG: hypothetical protein ACLFRD_00880 [Nitriliruptoraceae bacterium]